MSRTIDADALKEPIELQRASYARIGATERAEAYANCLWEIAQAPTIGGWISVKDRLPENEQYVILWAKTGVMKYAKYLDDEPHRPWITYDEDGSIRAWDNVVTHWMPLPEPPKEDHG